MAIDQGYNRATEQGQRSRGQYFRPFLSTLDNVDPRPVVVSGGAVRLAAGRDPRRRGALTCRVTRSSKSVVAGVDIRCWVCVVFSVLHERERQAGAGDDELPAK